jgi:hypothetical protein
MPNGRHREGSEGGQSRGGWCVISVSASHSWTLSVLTQCSPRRRRAGLRQRIQGWGDLDAYFQSNLASYVDKSGGVWRLKASGEGAPPVSAGTLRQFQNAEVIRTAFLGGGAAASVVGRIRSIWGCGGRS